MKEKLNRTDRMKKNEIPRLEPVILGLGCSKLWVEFNQWSNR